MRPALAVAVVLALPAVALARPPTTGKLLLTVNVGARCEAAGKILDVLPSLVGILEVPAGTVQLVCRANSYDDAMTYVTVQPGASALVKLDLLRSDRPRAGRVAVEPKSRLELVYLPGGPFNFGCEPGDTTCLDNEKPGRNITVDPFWMGKTDVTVEAYGRCVTAGECPRPSPGAHCNWGVAGRERYPINCIDWGQATRFCGWIGGRLPSAEEWEYAAKSGEPRVYPWGNAPLTGERANFCDAQCKKANKDWKALDIQDDGWPETSPAGSFPKGATKYGLLDMSGDVWQWTSSRYNETIKELRGGAWDVPSARMLRASYRSGGPPDGHGRSVGFRCAL